MIIGCELMSNALGSRWQNFRNGVFAGIQRVGLGSVSFSGLPDNRSRAEMDASGGPDLSDANLKFITQ
jgi:hypothetical protein